MRSAITRPFETPPHEQHALPLRLEVVHQLVEPAHPARIELRVVLQDEERSALVVLPPLDDVFEESVVAQVGCNGAPADDRAGEAVVFQEVALNTTRKVAPVALQDRWAPLNGRPPIKWYPARTQLLLHEFTPLGGGVGVDVERSLEERWKLRPLVAVRPGPWSSSKAEQPAAQIRTKWCEADEEEDGREPQGTKPAAGRRPHRARAIDAKRAQRTQS